MKNRTGMTILSLALVMLVLAKSCTVICAKEDKERTTDTAVVFVLDSSGSMKTNDREYTALDSMKQMLDTLPVNIQSAFVTYGEEARVQLPLQTEGDQERFPGKLEQIEYTGYSNAGAGLSCAVEMLGGTEAQERYIVLMSDGEILMGTDAATEESLLLYQSAVMQAQKLGIKIYVIGIGEDMSDRTNSIYAAAEKTQGKNYHLQQTDGMQRIVDAIVQQEWQIKQSTVAIVDADGELEQVSVDLPYDHADKLRIILTGSAPISNLHANFQAEEASQVNGRRYSVIELTRPYGSRLDISFEAAAGTQVRVNLQAEYQVIPVADVRYHDAVPTAAQAVYYERSAEVSCGFYSKENQDVLLWTEDYFEHAKVCVTTGEAARDLAIENGRISMTKPVEKETVLHIMLDYSSLPVNVIGNQLIELPLEAAPLLPIKEPEPEPEPPYLLIVLGISAAAVLIALLIIWYRQSHKKPEPLPEDRPEPGKYSYTGKLNLYVTRTQSGYDIPPLSYNLFRLPSGKVVSLKEVLESCDVQESFEGSDKIYLKAGANRSLLLTNHSDCTIMRNREILMKRKTCQLMPEAKVDITFEDEISEITFQYKDLKPSQMW